MATIIYPDGDSGDSSEILLRHTFSNSSSTISTQFRLHIFKVSSAKFNQYHVDPLAVKYVGAAENTFRSDNRRARSHSAGHNVTHSIGLLWWKNCDMHSGNIDQVG